MYPTILMSFHVRFRFLAGCKEHFECPTHQACVDGKCENPCLDCSEHCEFISTRDEGSFCDCRESGEGLLDPFNHCSPIAGMDDANSGNGIIPSKMIRGLFTYDW